MKGVIRKFSVRNLVLKFRVRDKFRVSSNVIIVILLMLTLLSSCYKFVFTFC